MSARELMAQRKAEIEAARVRQEDKILADAQLPDADLFIREVAAQILDRRNSPR